MLKVMIRDNMSPIASEPPDASHPIFAHPHAIFTPHLGASTSEAQVKVAEMVARQIAAYLVDNVVINAVNFPISTGLG